MIQKELFTAMLLSAHLLYAPTSFARSLKSPVDVARQTTTFENTAIRSDRECPALYALPSRLQSVAFYRDDKNSIVDKDLSRRNEELLKSTVAEEDNLSRLVTSVLSERNAVGASGSCLVSHLLQFPRQRAFLDTEDLRGTGAMRLCSVTPILAYLIARDTSLLTKDQDDEMLSWIHSLALRLQIAEKRYSYRNNIAYWTWAALALAAIALNDNEMLQEALDATAVAITEVSENRLLPDETARGDMALSYNLFAAQALSIVVSAGQANERDLLTEGQGQRLLRFFQQLAEIILEPSKFISFGGSSDSVRPEHVDRQNMGFLTIYYRVTNSDTALKAICDNRPLYSWRTGGDWYVLFGDYRWCAPRN
jgi:hypothetical protein